MIYDLQKASVLKRISASLLDIILALIIATGLFFALSSIFHYDSRLDDYNESIAVYKETIKPYDIMLGDQKYSEIEDPDSLPSELKILYYENKRAMENDPIVLQLFDEVITKQKKLISLTLLFVTFGVLLSILTVEFFIPLILGNGQTPGKKMFGICLMMDNGVKVRTLPLFVRALLGKFTVETMIPVYAAVYLFFGQVNLLMVFLTLAMIMANLLMIIINPRNALLHDVMSYIVAVDKHSQMMFETEEELIKYKEEVARKNAASKRTL